MGSKLSTMGLVMRHKDAWLIPSCRGLRIAAGILFSRELYRNIYNTHLNKGVHMNFITKVINHLEQKGKDGRYPEKDTIRQEPTEQDRIDQIVQEANEVIMHDDYTYN